MSTINTNQTHKNLKRDVEKIINKHAGHLSAQEVLATMSYMVGMTVALQDQTAMTPEHAMEVVSMNIQLGNQSVVDELLGNTGGNA